MCHVGEEETNWRLLTLGSPQNDEVKLTVVAGMICLSFKSAESSM